MARLKAAQRTVDILTTRVDACATAVELADAKKVITERIDELEKTNNARHEQSEATQAMNTKRIITLEQLSRTLATKAEVSELEGRMNEADAAQVDPPQKINKEYSVVSARRELKRIPQNKEYC